MLLMNEDWASIILLTWQLRFSFLPRRFHHNMADRVVRRPEDCSASEITAITGVHPRTLYTMFVSPKMTFGFETIDAGSEVRACRETCEPHKDAYLALMCATLR